MILAALALLLAQDASAAGQPRTVAEDRLSVCLDRARTDPTTAIVEASNWAAQVTGPDASHPHQCLGLAYTVLLRWEAAERAFLTAREVAGATEHFRRAQLATMAGNAALADERPADALASLALAADDAAAAGDNGLRALVEVDRARAQVMQGNEAEAEALVRRARVGAGDLRGPVARIDDRGSGIGARAVEAHRKPVLGDGARLHRRGGVLREEEGERSENHGAVPSVSAATVRSSRAMSLSRDSR